MYQRTVLIVEDEPLIRMMLADALMDDGYAVHEAGSVLEALAILGQRQFDAVITDIDMPGSLDGLDLARLVQSFPRQIATIVTSGGRLVASEALPGAARFMPKPYSLALTLEMLVEMIGAPAGETSMPARTRAA